MNSRDRSKQRFRRHRRRRFSGFVRRRRARKQLQLKFKPRQEQKPGKQPAPPQAVEELKGPKPAPKGPKRQVLLCPGPVNLSSHVRSALSSQEICHREPEFAHLMQTVRAKLLHALGCDGRYTSVIIGGSGTAALEAAVLSSLEPGRKLLVVNNGVYGSRIAQMARIHQMPLVEIRSTLTDWPDLSRVAAALKRDSDIGTVALVRQETSTGMLKPVEGVAALAKKYRRRVLVDAISSLGAERLDLARNNIGICVGSAGKCLHGAPGLSFVLLSGEEASRIGKLKPHSLYLDLASSLKAQEAGDPPFTPAVPLFAAFHAALDDLNKEGLRLRIARYRQRASSLRAGFKKLGLRFLLDDKLLSNTLTALWLPKGLAYQTLHDRLKRAGFVIYAGQSELAGKIFRVAHMGQLLQSDLKDFQRVLKEVLDQAVPKEA